MGIQLTECDCKNLIHLDQDRAQWQPVANTVMNLQGLQKTGYFFFFQKRADVTFPCAPSTLPKRPTNILNDSNHFYTVQKPVWISYNITLQSIKSVWTAVQFENLCRRRRPVICRYANEWSVFVMT